MEIEIGSLFQLHDDDWIISLSHNASLLKHFHCMSYYLDMLSILTGKRVNKLLQHIKEQNKNGCKMVTRGLDLRVCDSVEDAGMMGMWECHFVRKG